MDKRTRILLIVLAAVILVGGGIYGYMYMTASRPVPAPVTARPSPARGRAPAKAAPGKPAPAKSAARPPAPAPYVPVIKVIEKGRQVEYDSPEKFLAKTTMAPAAIRAFAKRALDEAKKTRDSLAKRKIPNKVALDRAGGDLKMMERLAALVGARYPEEAQKPYSYLSLGKRDPFMSPFEIPKVYPKVTPGMTPLEKNPTEVLVLKAVIWNQSGYRALLETPDGRAYTVRVGDRVGNKGGRITKITKKMLYVTERITNILGDIEIRNIVLKLYTEKEAE